MFVTGDTLILDTSTFYSESWVFFTRYILLQGFHLRMSLQEHDRGKLHSSHMLCTQLINFFDYALDC